MKRTILSFLFVLSLSVAGTVQSSAQHTWTFTNQRKSNSFNRVYLDLGMSYNYHNSSTTWGSQYCTDQYANGVTGDKGDMIIGESSGNSLQISFLIFSDSLSIPSYSKFERKASFTMYYGGNRHYHGGGLYLFDDESTAKSTSLDVSVQQNYEWGEDYLIGKLYSTDDTYFPFKKSLGSRDIIYDNSTGSASKDVVKYIVQTHVSTDETEPKTCRMWMTWKETSSSSETWYYYKYFTFKKNDGTDAQVGGTVTVKNSGNLSTPSAPSRPGYGFAGWNTLSDGSGTSYTNGQAITASLSDKGPVTLYAQWEILDGSSDHYYSSIYCDSNLIVPDNVVAYGFTYSDGALVRGAAIPAGSILPANKGFVAESLSDSAFDFQTTDSSAGSFESDLVGTTSQISTPAGDVFVWSKPDGYNYGFFKYTGSVIPAGKAYYIKD